MLSAGSELLPFQHPVDLLKLAHQVGAAELDFLVAATRAGGVMVYWHGLAVLSKSALSGTRPPQADNP
jgi:hypothetical protein